MKIVSRLLLVLMLVAVAASCGGSMPSTPSINDYRNGTPDRRIRPESLCRRNSPGWICSGGSSKPPIYGTQGDCGSGYLYFSDGCEDTGTSVALYPNWSSFFTILDLAAIKFNDSHFWARHLACYLTGSTNRQVDGAISNDFNLNHFEKADDPPVGSTGNFYFTYTDPKTGKKTIKYAIFHVGKYQWGLVEYQTYIVGTAYILGLPNCPGY